MRKYGKLFRNLKRRALFFLYSHAGVDFRIQERLMPTEQSIIIYFNPASVNYCLTNKNKRKLKNEQRDRFCKIGDWDNEVVRIEEERYDIFKTIEQLFVQNFPYQETVQYISMRNRLASGAKAFWCESEEDLDLYFFNLMEAYKAIEKGDYRTQLELARMHPDLVDPRSVNGKCRDEIQLYIGRCGELIFNGTGGTHRLFISKVLELERVPGIIMGVHRDWLYKKFYRHPSGNLKKVLNYSVFDNWDGYEIK